MAMDFAIKLPYHKRLFLAVFVLSWTTIAGFIVFQYIREKQYKSEYLSARLQAYNHNLLETVEYGLSYEDYINTYTKPFDSLRKSQSARNNSRSDAEYGMAVRTITLSPRVAE